MNEKMLDLLYRSFDADLSKEERATLQQALAKLQELRAEKEQIAALREEISKSGMHSFRPFFATRVINRIRNEQSENEGLFDALTALFKRFAIAGALAAALLFVLNLRKMEQFSLDSLLGVRQIQIEDTWTLQDTIQEVGDDQ